MSLEDRINQHIPDWLDQIEQCGWYGSPWADGGIGVKQVHCLIQDAPLAECLTSPSEYVREYRKYYESRKYNK